MITAHELAYKLLAGENLPVMIESYSDNNENLQGRVDIENLPKLLCNIAYKNGFILTYKLEVINNEK